MHKVREYNYSSCTGRSSENVYSSEWRRSGKKERGDDTQFTTKIGGKN